MENANNTDERFMSEFTHKLGSRILKILASLIKQKKYSKKFDIVVGDSILTIDYMIIGENDQEQNNRDEGYNYLKNTIFINIRVVGGKLQWYDVVDTVYHEVKHYEDFLEKQEPLTDSNYARGMADIKGNEITAIRNLSRIMYFSNKYEINAYVNGAYAVALKNRDVDLSDIEGFINSTNLKDMFSVLSSAQSYVLSHSLDDDFKKAYDYMTENGIVPKDIDYQGFIKYFMDMGKEAYKYFMELVEKAYNVLKRNTETKNSGN